MPQNKHLPILLIVLLAFALRVWQLPHTPPGLWYDEAYYAMDAAWLNDGGPWLLFFAGNNGREPLFIYLQAVWIYLLGAQPFTSRLLGAYIGVLTIPTLYILARRLTRLITPPPAQWTALIATFTLTTSIWHLTLSRSGFRGVLLPLMTCLVFYTFWRAWSKSSYLGFALSGLLLGISQYTYLAARALPLVFILFAPLATVLMPSKQASKSLWLGLIFMAVISAAVFAPLGAVFYQHPDLFSARTNDVLFTPNSRSDLFQHFGAALRLFIDQGDENWRHHLPNTPMLGWLGVLGFWPGLWLCLRRIRQTPYLFLLLALITLYLPALLADPPIHALRLSSLLPIYGLIFALGLGWGAAQIGRHSTQVQAALIIGVMVSELSLTSYNYFQVWAQDEHTYIEYNGPLVDLVNTLIAQSDQHPVLIPLHLYVHPTTRYLLHDRFTEQTTPPSHFTQPVHLITLPDKFRILNVANIPDLPALVWLEQGRAYVSRPPRQTEQAALTSLPAEFTRYQDRLGREVARGYSFDPNPIKAMFTQTEPQRTANLIWGHQAQLVGYEVSPELIRPNHPLTLNLYWHSLTDLTFEQRLFLQLIASNGQPIAQWEGDAFMEDMYRWRPDGLLPTQHTLWIDAHTPPGAYLVRLGFFDDTTQQRLPLTNLTDHPNQIQIGLFYVGETDPRQPQTPIHATFSDVIDLLGLTTTRPVSGEWSLTLQWQSRRPTDRPYTVFLQLLNESGQVITSLDKQPLNGLYPTSLWSPQEIIADTFLLTLPPTGLPPGRYQLVTGFYDLNTGQRLPTTAGGDMVTLTSFTIQ